ncbi:hypothetical protein [Streptomyces sp. IMTB 2501]|uniref:hypothetical protein n=1 Tax=Streptomyces sp. IMTB 2501 TaxID=1776340 RepID=UPI00273ECC2F|nr:hypothetical protein [Streptomyces sp. IMTB 2501]
MTGVAVAAVGTAAMMAITLPGTAGADTSAGAGGGTQAGQGPDAVRPGVVEQAPAEGGRAPAGSR